MPLNGLEVPVTRIQKGRLDSIQKLVMHFSSVDYRRILSVVNFASADLILKDETPFCRSTRRCDFFTANICKVHVQVVL